MPLLAGGQAASAASTRRARARTLVARQVSLDGPKAVVPMAQALVEAAAWVGCTDVRVERVDAPELREPAHRDEIGRALQRAYR